MTKKHQKHPHHKKVHITKNHRALWVIGLFIFIIGFLIDNAWIIIPGGMLAIYGVLNRHSWHIAHHK